MQTAQYACRQCAEAKKHCDKLMPTCSRCEKYEFSCDIGKKPRNKPKLRSEKACAKVTQDHVVTTCLERISHCLALEALEKDDQSQAAENDEAPQTGSFEEQARQRIEDSISRLPPAVLTICHAIMGYMRFL